MRELHQSQPVFHHGAPLEEADAALIMVHGRGASAEDILTLADDVGQPGLAYLAPQAANHTWYPQSFLAPIEQNEPYLSSALQRLEEIVALLGEAGLPPERIMLLGFSQGACLSLEFIARNARRYGGAAGLSGGLIGPEGTARDYEGSLAGTPIFLGCSTTDFHIPEARVHETAEVLERLGAEVTKRLYPNMGHTINQDEIERVRRLVSGLVEGTA